MYQLIWHKNLTPEKWSKFSFPQQLLMIGNEINRLLNGIKNHQSRQELIDCIERLLELIDITVDCQDYKYKKELLRFRELIAKQYLFNEKQLRGNEEEIYKLYKILLLTNSKTAELVI